jgi:hypothetical protein
VRAVAAGHEVAAELVIAAVLAVADERARRLEPGQLDSLDLEVDGAAGREARGDEVLYHLLLAVDGDRPPAGQIGERDAVAAAIEAEQDAVVDQPLALQPVGQPEAVQEIDGALLQHAGAHALLDVVAAPVLEHDRGDAGAVEQVREHQPGRTSSDDGDLRVDRDLRVRTGRRAARCAG